MTPAHITALIPSHQGAASTCIILHTYEAPQNCYCTVEQYINIMAKITGNSNTACRKLFPHMRGTGLKFNDGTVFIALKMSPMAPCLGYVRYTAITSLESTPDGHCLLRLKHHHPLPILWTLPTVLKHLHRLQKTFELPALPVIN